MKEEEEEKKAQLLVEMRDERMNLVP